MDESSFSAAPAPTDWDRDVAIQREAVAARLNALSLLYLHRAYHSAAGFEFRASVRLLVELLDDLWAPVVRMHTAQRIVDLALYHEVRAALVELLTVSRGHGDAGNEAETERLRSVIDRLDGLADAAALQYHEALGRLGGKSPCHDTRDGEDPRCPSGRD